MITDSWDRIQELFESALQKQSDQRESYLRSACEGDNVLYEEVLSLLAADNETHDLLRHPVLDSLNLSDALSFEGQQIGPYRIGSQIGSGGMGAVFMAERADGQFEQRVALKIIKPGMDTGEILRRFWRERQILAVLEHPSIARLLDGGVTERGVPYFTLEYVEGEAITDYCDKRGLGIEKRLELFEKVCEAVQYAHRNLVIHRDLKPSNIMVTESEEVKLLDFGISTVLSGEEGPGSTLLTGEGRRVMTPEYASPEQIKGNPVTTSSDVYSLGMVFYELLSGTRPYEFPDRSMMEIERVVNETVPRKPSTEVGKKDGFLCHRRGMSRDRLRKRLAGDLDNICLKSLEKEPERRYGTVEQLQQDIARHRHGIPITARPATVGYRLEKFVSRHRLGFIGSLATVIFVGLLVVYYTLRLSAERDLAQLEAQKAEQISDFLTSIFEVSDPGESRGENITAHELLDRGADRISRELLDQPEIQAEMLEVIGFVYYTMGIMDDARPLLEKSVRMRRELYGNENIELAENLHKFGALLVTQRDDSLAEVVLLEALRIRQKLKGEDDLTVAGTMNLLGWMYNNRAKFSEARFYFEKAISIYEKHNKMKSKGASITLNNLALLLHEQAKFSEAEPLYRKALAAQIQIFGDLHPEVNTTRYNLSQLLWETGKYQESETLKREVVEKDRKILGNHHPDLAYSLTNLAKALRHKGEYDSSEAMFREALEIREKAFGPEHPQVIFSLNEVGQSLYEKEKHQEAETLHRSALKLAQKTWQNQHTEVARSYRFVGRCLLAQKKWREAQLCFEQGIEINRISLGDQHPNTAHALVDMGKYKLARADFEQAEHFLLQAKNIYTLNYGELHPAVGSTLLNLAKVFLKTSRTDSAEVFAHRAMNIFGQNFSSRHPDIAAARLVLGEVYLMKGDLKTAESLLRECLMIRSEQLPPDHSEIAGVKGLLGECLVRQNNSSEGAPLLRSGYEVLLARFGSQDPGTRRLKQWLDKISPEKLNQM